MACNNEATTTTKAAWGTAKKAASFVAAQWLLLAFGVACALAYYFPWIAAHGGAIRSEYSIMYGAVAVIFLVSGLQLAPGQLRHSAANWRLHAVVQGMSFVVFPAVVLAVVHVALAAGALASRTPAPSVLVGLVAVACLPTTIASNVVMTRAAGGDEAAAVVSVVVGNVAGALLSPLLVYGLVPRAAELAALQPAGPATFGRMYAAVARQVGLAVLLPLALGQAVRWSWERKTARLVASLKLAKLSSLCLVLLVWTTFSGAFDTGALLDLSTASLLFDIFLNVALYALFTALCFLAARPPSLLAVKPMSKPQTVAVCFCGAAKTTSLGIPLVAAMWSAADDLTRAYIQIPVLLYTIEQIFMAQILVYIFRRYLRRGKAADAESQAAENQAAENQAADGAVGAGGSPPDKNN